MGSDYYMNPPRTHTYFEARIWAWAPSVITLYRITEGTYAEDNKTVEIAKFNNNLEIRNVLDALDVDVVQES